MANITGANLIARGWKPGPAIGHAIRAANGMGPDQGGALSLLERVRDNPGLFQGNPAYAALIKALQPTPTAQPLRDTPIPYQTWGVENIEAGAIEQMDAAMRLPVAVAGALLPDAHLGYGLPIGGVLATQDCVIPYAVGVDIACRMRLSVYESDPAGYRGDQLREALLERTYFGVGVTSPEGTEHEVLDDTGWNATPLLKELRDKAIKQIGTSGTGNHFVEWGELNLAADNDLGIPEGTYLALLSHSGSRGVGFKIANTYSKLAATLHPGLDESVKHLAWLPLDEEAGSEYWLAMELAGRFASANHHVIHQNVASYVGLKELASVENHHNFAWKENGAIVHRKGATPASKGTLGIIPGSMGDPGYIVRGKGSAESLDSASHGAGRTMGRRAALRTITIEDRDQWLKERGIELLGGGLDESPQAYKRIADVIAAQSDLVELIGAFHPKIVRMANEAGDV